MSDYILSIIIFLPIGGALFILLIPAARTGSFRTVNLAVTVLQLLVVIVGLLLPGEAGAFRWVEQRPWFSVAMGNWGAFQAEYFLGADGLSLPLMMLSVVVMVIVAIASWHVNKNTKGYFALLLVLNGAVLGTFAALDFLLFYLFFEFMLLPMYFLIGLWGGPRREYASIKFLLYTLFGSLLILIVLIGFYVSAKSPLFQEKIVHTLNLIHLGDPSNMLAGSLFDAKGVPMAIGSPRSLGFLLLLIGFAIKVPAAPFHTWLPDAHVEAPTAISVVLAALLLKVGAYGLIRIAYPLFPEVAADLSWLVALLGVTSIIYGALCAMASKDLKRLIAYSSVSHMGFVLLGLASITTVGLAGAVYQMVSHGILTSMLFLIAGVLGDRTGDRTINNYSGLATRMPVYFAAVLIGFFGSIGLPGLSGFIGEVMVLFGAFQSNAMNGLIHESFSIVAVSGIILGAGYFLWTIQRMFFGSYYVRINIPGNGPADLDRRERLMLFTLASLTFVLGIFPQLLLDYINPFAERFGTEFMNHVQALGGL